MEWAEMKSNLDLVKSAIEIELERHYPVSNDNKKRLNHSLGKIFHTGKNGDISLYIMGYEEPWDCITIEYDDGEDGDLFYTSEYDSLEAMVSDMIDEIEV